MENPLPNFSHLSVQNPSEENTETENPKPENPESKIYDESELCLEKIRCIHGTKTPHGKCTVWYPHDKAPPGTAKIKTHYLEGVPHGNHKEYYPNGQLKVQVELNRGQQVGPPQRWDEQGKKIS